MISKKEYLDKTIGIILALYEVNKLYAEIANQINIP